MEILQFTLDSAPTGVLLSCLLRVVKREGCGNVLNTNGINVLKKPKYFSELQDYFI